MQDRSRKFLRGLGLGLTLSIVNLLGAFLTVAALGGLGEWTRSQFLGVFGTVEIATGLAFVFAPNIWRLPIAEARLKRTDVQFAASTILIPHWAGGVKSVAGAVFVVIAAVNEGVGPATPGLLAVVFAVNAVCVGLSMLFARLGLNWPGIDVYTVIIRRPGHGEMTLPDISLGASLVQILLSIGTFPAIKIFSPSALYQPEIGPSPTGVAWCAAFAVAFLGAGFAAWSGRLTWSAPRAQQHDAEQAAAAHRT